MTETMKRIAIRPLSRILSARLRGEDPVKIEKEITSRIGRASAAYYRLNNRVFNNRDILISTKLKVCNAVILPSFLYGYDTWTTYTSQVKKHEKYHHRNIRPLGGFRRVIRGNFVKRT